MLTKNRNIIISGIIILLIFVAGVVIFYTFKLNQTSTTGQLNQQSNSQPNDSAPSENTSPVSQSTSNQEEVKQIVQEAVNAQDNSACGSLGGEEKKYCLQQLIAVEANVKRDPTLCSKIEQEVYRNACLDNITYVKARDEKNISLCSTMLDKTRIEDCRKAASGK